LQRFTPVDHAHYQLHVRETLTLKPEGFTLRMKARVHDARAPQPAATAAPAHRPTPEAKATWTAPPVIEHETPALVLFGSNSGSSEAFARRIASDASVRGYAATVAPMDQYTGRLPKTGVVIVVTASYNGQPAENARKFVEWLDGVGAGALTGV